MPNPIDPLVASLAFVAALPFAWAPICAFARSAHQDFREAREYPLLSFLGFWFPQWTLLKLSWLLVVLAALTVSFHELYFMALK